MKKWKKNQTLNKNRMFLISFSTYVEYRNLEIESRKCVRKTCKNLFKICILNKCHCLICLPKHWKISIYLSDTCLFVYPLINHFINHYINKSFLCLSKPVIYSYILIQFLFVCGKERKKEYVQYQNNNIFFLFYDHY